MRSTKELIMSTKYLSGKPSYKGAILARYGSTYHAVTSMRPQISHAGNIVLPVDANVTSACKKLQKGQIGARKDNDQFSGGTTILNEIIAEVNTLEVAYETAKTGKSALLWFNDILQYKGVNGNILSLAEVLELRKQYHSKNEQIREKINETKKLHGFKKGTKMSDTLLEELQTLYEGMYSMTGMDLIISISEKHYINLTNDFVECSDPQSFALLKDSANYNKSGNRLVGSKPVSNFVVPIQSLSQLTQIKSVIEDKYLSKLMKLKYELVCSERYNPNGLDLDAAREYDRNISNS